MQRQKDGKKDLYFGSNKLKKIKVRLVQHISRKENIVDILTKPILLKTFLQL